MAVFTDVIETERLRLRGIDETDTAAIVGWRSVPGVYRYFRSPHRITEAEHLVWFRTRYLPDESRRDWMCLTRENGERIGVFGLIRRDDAAEVSYLLAPEAQGRGYASEAVGALAGYAAGVWGVRKLTAEIHRDNAPSLRLAERLGFRPLRPEGCFITYEKEV